MVDAEDLDSIPRSRRSPGAGNGSPLQYSYLENPMDRGAWQAAVHGVAKSWVRLSTNPFHCKRSSAIGCTVPAFLPDHNVAYMWYTEYLFFVLVSLHIPKFGSPSKYHLPKYHLDIFKVMNYLQESLEYEFSAGVSSHRKSSSSSSHPFLSCW